MTNASKQDEKNEVETLVQTIHLRFPLTPVPEIVVEIPDFDLEGIIEAMQGRRWTEVDFAVTSKNTRWLFDMSDDVRVYYLPSYLVGYLSAWPQTINSSRPRLGESTLVDSFDDFFEMLDITRGDSFDASRMDAGMKACVGEFLRFFAAKHRSATGMTDFNDDLETLTLIWLEWTSSS